MDRSYSRRLSQSPGRSPGGSGKKQRRVRRGNVEDSEGSLFAMMGGARGSPASSGNTRSSSSSSSSSSGDARMPPQPPTPGSPRTSMPRTPPRSRGSGGGGCRFIPNRSGSHLNLAMSWPTGADENGSPARARGGGAADAAAGAAGGADGKDPTSQTYALLLQSEILGIEARLGLEARTHGGGDAAAMEEDDPLAAGAAGAGSSSMLHRNALSRATALSPGQNVLRFRRSIAGADASDSRAAFSLSPVGSASLRLMSRPTKSKRKIAKVPFKVLDAPALQDDFYLNLVDWSSQNVLAVGLGSSVYLWSACTSKVTRLCDLGPEDSITSVSWTQHGRNLSVGTNSGQVQIWDAVRCKEVRRMDGHTARVGTMAWNSQTLATGSRDRMIFLRDVRSEASTVQELPGHRQEVCGLKWSFDEQQLASGGNDNKLCIWDAATASAVARFGDHTAAVKAIAWSPHQHGLLASGGGTADRKIRFWNTLTKTPLSCVDTDSQVCNLTWSKNVNEIVSTHGYSLNQIIVWRYPSMSKVATLTGHTYRVLYLAMSPDGQTIVTGAGDETLRFWNVFPGPGNRDGSRLGTSLLFPSGADIR